MYEYKEIYFIIAIALGTLVGCFFGTFPLIFGIIRKKIWLGILGIVVCIAFGLLITYITEITSAALLSAIPATIITVLIFLLSKKQIK